MRKNNRYSNEETTFVIRNEEPLNLLNGPLLSGVENNDPRSIWFTNEVYPDTVATALQQIININYLDDQEELRAALSGQTYIRHPIKLFISSYGGNVYDGLGLVGLIRTSKTPVHTYAVGKVMSMGFILAISGHKRFAYPHTSFMFHSLSSVHWGKFSELQESVIEDERLQSKLDGITTSLTAITQDRLDEVHVKKLDWFFDAEEAISLKCADELIV